MAPSDASGDSSQVLPASGLDIQGVLGSHRGCKLIGDEPVAQRRIVSKLAAAEGGIPADNDFVAWQRGRRPIVELEPRPLDEIAASRNRRLLILGRELHCTHRCLQFIESNLGFPLRMKQTADLTTEAAGRA